MRMIVTTAAPAAFVLALAAGSGGAQAQPRAGQVCGDRDNILAHLSDNFEEKPVAIGLDSRGRVMEVLAAESGTWTVVITMPNGLSCLLASGQRFEQILLQANHPSA